MSSTATTTTAIAVVRLRGGGSDAEKSFIRTEASRSDLGVGKVAASEKPPRAQQQDHEQYEEAHRIAITRRDQPRYDVLRDAQHDAGDDRAVHAAQSAEHDDDESLHRQRITRHRSERVDHRDQRSR